MICEFKKILPTSMAINNITEFEVEVYIVNNKEGITQFIDFCSHDLVYFRARQ